MFKSLQLSCPHNHQANEVLVHTFIKGLKPNTKFLLDSAAGEQVLEKTYAELFTLLNRVCRVTPSEMKEELNRSYIRLWNVRNGCSDNFSYTNCIHAEYDDYSF